MAHPRIITQGERFECVAIRNPGVAEKGQENSEIVPDLEEANTFRQLLTKYPRDEISLEKRTLSMELGRAEGAGCWMIRSLSKPRSRISAEEA